MFGSQILDVVIGVVFVYLSLSMVCSGLGELVASWRKKRQALLKEAMDRLLQAGATSPDFWDHPLIHALRRGDSEDDYPSYLPARTVALTIVDLVTGVDGSPPAVKSGADQAKPPPSTVAERSVAKLDQVIASLRAGAGAGGAPPKMARALLLLAQEAGDFESFLRNVERWFNEAMDRLTGRFKRWSRRVLIVAGFVITIFADADSFEISTRLYRDTAFRASIIEMAKAAQGPEAEAAPTGGDGKEGQRDDKKTKDGTGSDGKSSEAAAPTPVGAIKGQVEQLRAIVGWSREDAALMCPYLDDEWNKLQVKAGVVNPSRPIAIVMKFVGWFITAFALALGAPFWFNALQGLLKMRSTPRVDTEPTEAAEAKKPA